MDVQHFARFLGHLCMLQGICYVRMMDSNDFFTIIDLFSFVCLLSHCRPRDVTLENYLFQIQANSCGNE